jgi:hypothetical protein
MRKYLLSSLAVLAFSVATLYANAEQLRVSVPYDFVAGGKLLPAGTYIIGRYDSTDAFLTIVDADRQQAATFILPISFESKVSSDSKLQFEQTGGVYLLGQIQTGSGVYTLAPESSELRMALQQSGRTSVGP